VVVDCASLTESLFESELFGHEKGAFTGAHMAKQGLVEAASGGTLFLDEVGDIPLPMQVKLLRLLESGTYRRVGSTELRRADVRVVSATHRDLQRMMAEGRFREDLFYRLSTFPIPLPALRERIDDIPLLAASLLERVAPKRRLRISPAALQRLCRHAFPGNVRELRNVLERAALLSDGERIELAAIEQALSVGTSTAGAGLGLMTALPAPDADRGLDLDPGQAPASRAAPQQPVARLREAQQQALRAAVAAHQGSRAALARSLGLSVRSLYRKLRELDQAGG
jgi:DNA-binding NtrC family response regulator